MAEVALLNPQLELSLGKRMLKSVEEASEHFERRLTDTLLDREEYLRTFGAASAIRQLHEKLFDHYASAVNK